MKISSLFLLVILSIAMITISCEKEEVNDLGTYFTIFPNPASVNANIIINMDNTGDVLVSISNNVSCLEKFEYLSLDSGSHTISLNVTTYATGVYEVTITTPEGIYNGKLIVINN